LSYFLPEKNRLEKKWMEQVESSDNNEFSARTQAVIKQARDKTMEWTANMEPAE